MKYLNVLDFSHSIKKEINDIHNCTLQVQEFYWEIMKIYFRNYLIAWDLLKVSYGIQLSGVVDGLPPNISVDKPT